MVKSFKDFVKEGVELAQPAVKPRTTPKTTPSTKPGRPSPFRKDKPSVVPKPKASAEDIANKFLKLTENDENVNILLNKLYNSKNESLNEELTEGPEKTNQKFVTSSRPKVEPAPQRIPDRYKEISEENKQTIHDLRTNLNKYKNCINEIEYTLNNIKKKPYDYGEAADEAIGEVKEIISQVKRSN